MADQKQVPGVASAAPQFADSAGADTISRFAEALHPSIADDVVMWGRAPHETRVTVGHLREWSDELQKRIHAYVADIRKSLSDEFVVKSGMGIHITVGDLRDFAEKNPLKEAKK